MILLDTHALLWLEREAKRSLPLRKFAGNLYVSPATLLEVKFLIECERVRLHQGMSIENIISDPRWLVDDPPSTSWFQMAIDLDWTRDPFDRLLVAHARLRRWRFATADTLVLDRLPNSQLLEL